MNTERVEETLNTLRKTGSRITPARRAVISAMVAMGHHATAEELVEGVRTSSPEISVATVYRTLDTLEEAGIAYHVHLGHGPATWHLADDVHHHLVCQTCNSVVEIPTEAIDGVRELLAGTVGFDVDVRHFALLGRCRQCQ